MLSLSLNIKVMLEETLSDIVRGTPLNLHAWRRMKSRLMFGNENAIYLKASPNPQVIYVEKWKCVVLVSHGGASHHPLKETLIVLKIHWDCDLHDDGIVSACVEALVEHCGCQLVSKATPNDMLGTCIIKYNKTSTIEVIKVETLR